MPTECEAKLRVEKLETVRERLRRIGAVCRGDVFERNWVLDRPDGSLLREGTLLRVRNTGGAGGVLTVKRKSVSGAFKTREEVESLVDSTDTLLRQLEMTGFAVAGRYEKFRETWLWGGCTIALDDCPEMGCFVEIEGTPDSIRAAAADMGVDPDTHLDGSYLELWRVYLHERGENCTTPRDMLFCKDDAAFERHSIHVSFS